MSPPTVAGPPVHHDTPAEQDAGRGAFGPADSASTIGSEASAPARLASPKSPSWMLRAAVCAVLLYAGILTMRSLNANDLFWHLATGRQILQTGALPHADPFSFASDPHEWIDHEWLWQIGAQALYTTASVRVRTPDPRASLALIVSGILVVLAAFWLGLRRGVEDELPAAGLIGFGLVAAETARERLMVRPETASLLFLAIVLTILSRGRPGLRRGLWLAITTAIWSNVHPAALLVPVVVVLWGVGSAWDLHERRTGSWARIGRGILIEAALTAAATCLNPYGASLWSVPLSLARMVKTRAYVNPEWLSPPLLRFPMFYLAVAILAIAVLVGFMRPRRLPEGSVLIAIPLAVLAMQQMRHLGLFAVAFLFAGGAALRVLDPKRTLARILRARALVAVAILGVVAACVPTSIENLTGIGAESGLDPGRFPIEACERIAQHVPSGMRLYNDVQFGGYLIWRFYPERQVFIDGRNELYATLLARLAAIHMGEAPYDDWRALIREREIEGAVVKYQETKKGVIYPPARPGDAPVLGYRSWSAFLFPSSEWALVYFDDTALVFMKRGGAGEAWIRSDEYRDLNPEDRDYLLERAQHDPAFAERLRREAFRRLTESPPVRRVEELLKDLDGLTLRVTEGPRSVPPRS